MVTNISKTLTLNTNIQKDVKIRRLRKEDKNSLINITFGTAFLGESGAKIFDDPGLFFDLGYLYYFLFERNNSFVAVVDEKVVGYILCTRSVLNRNLTEIFYIIPFIVLPKLISFRYSIGVKTLKYIYLFTIDSIFGNNLNAPFREYPAALHINIIDEYRGKGLGSKLMKELLEELRKRRIKGLQLNTTSENKSAIALYRKFSFVEYRRRKSYMWEKFTSNKVNNISFVLDLKEGKL
jgi:ribosomal protein S18 acetylase RimI-like enzyme